MYAIKARIAGKSYDSKSEEMIVLSNASVALPPLVMNGVSPCQLAYPGYVDEHDDLCPVHGTFMHRFADGSVACLYCVEEVVKQCGETDYYGALQQIRIRHFKSWHRLHSATLSAASKQRANAEEALKRIIVAAAMRTGQTTTDVVSQMLSGNIGDLLPGYI